MEIWAEAYSVTGVSGDPTLLGKAPGETLQEACDNLMIEDDTFASFYDHMTLTYWGCKLFASYEEAHMYAGG